MKKVIQTIFRICVSPAVFLLFGFTGVLKLFRYGGGISVNFGREINPHEALTVLSNLIENAKENNPK